MSVNYFYCVLSKQTQSSLVMGDVSNTTGSERPLNKYVTLRILISVLHEKLRIL